MGYKESFQITKEAFKFLSNNKILIIFPLISSIIFITLPFHWLSFMRGVNPQRQNYILLVSFLYYIVGYFLVNFFNIALFSCVYLQLKGKKGGLLQGLKKSIKNSHKILIWSLFSATFGIILSTVFRKSKLIGKISTTIAAYSWNIITLFVIPVMIFENLGVFSSLKRSAELFKKTWGNKIILQSSVLMALGPLFVIVIISPIVLGILSLSLLNYNEILLALSFLSSFLLIILLFIVKSALSGIFKIPVYIYAKTGKVSSGFSEGSIKNLYLNRL